jgi:hypothetical protein
MNLWAKKTLINAGENTDVELPLQIFSNTTIPIILTESDSIINTVNIADEIINDQTRATQFLASLKNENEPIVIEYVGHFQKLYYGNSALLNKLNITLLLTAYHCIICSLSLLFLS